jgi:predicted SnoaL-like aldol condensation-catalyzing enzyme
VIDQQNSGINGDLMNELKAAANKTIAIEAITGAFVKKDTTIPEKLFATDYKQHNPTIPNGSASILAVILALRPDFKYEMGMVVAEGELVMIHGRYTGWASKPLVAVDIFRIVDGRLVEHWDVMQEEVPADRTVSGNPMFASSTGQ